MMLCYPEKPEEANTQVAGLLQGLTAEFKKSHTARSAVNVYKNTYKNMSCRISDTCQINTDTDFLANN